MRIIATEKEKEFIKTMLDGYGYDCNDCPYTEDCDENGTEVCSHHILKHILFQRA